MLLIATEPIPNIAILPRAVQAETIDSNGPRFLGLIKMRYLARVHCNQAIRSHVCMLLLGLILLYGTMGTAWVGPVIMLVLTGSISIVLSALLSGRQLLVVESRGKAAA